MRILFILPEFLPSSGGGIITFYSHLIQSLIKNGNEVVVLVGSGVSSNTFEGQLSGVNIFSITDTEIKKYHSKFSKYDIFPSIRNHLSAAWAMYDKSKALGDFDVIECTDWGLGFVPFVVNKEKVIVQFHASEGEINFKDPIEGSEIEGSLFRLIETTVLKKAPILMAHSLATQVFWQNELQRNDIHYQLPAYQTLPFKDNPTLSDYAIVVARLQNWKGPEILCKSLLEVKSKTPIKWIGRNMHSGNASISMESYLSKKYTSIWNKTFIYEGAKNYETTQQLIKTSKFVIIPSIWDVFNFTCIEAMAQGKVVICSSGAGAADLIEDGVNGFIFETANHMQLSSIIDRVCLLGKQELLQIGDNAFTTIENKLNPNIISLDRMNIYTKKFKINSYFTKWEEELFLPAEKQINSLHFVLSKQPLRLLYKYVINRILAKLNSRCKV